MVTNEKVPVTSILRLVLVWQSNKNPCHNEIIVVWVWLSFPQTGHALKNHYSRLWHHCHCLIVIPEMQPWGTQITYILCILTLGNDWIITRPWSKSSTGPALALLQKLTVTQIVKNTPASYGIQWFITMVTTACHWSVQFSLHTHTLFP
jgi:hypothetical protein